MEHTAGADTMPENSPSNLIKMALDNHPRYRRVKDLGSGTFGTVQLCDDLRNPPAKVAVKLIPRGPSTVTEYVISEIRNFRCAVSTSYLFSFCAHQDALTTCKLCFTSTWVLFAIVYAHCLCFLVHGALVYCPPDCTLHAKFSHAGVCVGNRANALL
jgi:hypothetical protein